MSAWKADLVTASVDQRSCYECFYRASIKSASVFPHEEEISKLIPNRRRPNVVSTSPMVLPDESGVIPKKRYLYLPFVFIVLKSIRRPSHISSILPQRLPAWAVIPTVIRFRKITQHTPESQSPLLHCEGFRVIFRCIAYLGF